MKAYHQTFEKYLNEQEEEVKKWDRWDWTAIKNRVNKKIYKSLLKECKIK